MLSICGKEICQFFNVCKPGKNTQDWLQLSGWLAARKFEPRRDMC